MIAAELKEEGVPKSVAKDIRIYLQSKPIYKWHGYFQDIGFVAVVTKVAGVTGGKVRTVTEAPVG